MTIRLTSKKVTLPSRPASGVHISINTYSMKGYADGMIAAAQKAKREAVRRAAHRFFRLTQQNIQTMRITDRGMLLRSGYCRRVEGTDDWVVGYTAPYAWYVDLGTGPKAGHGPYSAPPPYDIIRGWVSRNLGVMGIKEVKPRANPTRTGKMVTNHFRRIKNAQGGYTMVMKPMKPTRDVTAEFKRLGKSKDDQEVIDDITNRVVWSIFKHGTAPHPFWRRAQAQLRHIRSEEDNAAVGRLMARGAKYAFFNILRRGLRVVGGRAR